MPFTPFHFGPGALVSLASRRTVSFLSFCAANVVIDVESLYNMVAGRPRIHTFLHTYIGATLAAAVVVVGFLCLRRVSGVGRRVPYVDLHTLPLKAVTLGALVGAWSHVFLDSLMHGDITPLAPFSDANPMLGVLTLGQLHLLCAATGAIALVWFLWRSERQRAAAESSEH